VARLRLSPPEEVARPRGEVPHKARIDLRLLEGRNAPGNPVNPVAFVSAGLSAIAFIDDSVLNPPTAADVAAALGGTRRLLLEPAMSGAEALARFDRALSSRQPAAAGPSTDLMSPTPPSTGPAATWRPPGSEGLSDEEMLAQFFEPWQDSPFAPGPGDKGGVVTPGGPGLPKGTSSVGGGGGHASGPSISPDTTSGPLTPPPAGTGAQAAAPPPGPAAGGQAGALGAGPALGAAHALGAGLLTPPTALGAGLLTPPTRPTAGLPQAATPPALPLTVPAGIRDTLPPDVVQKLGQLGIRFEENVGQTDGQVQFLSRGPGYNLFLTPTQAVLDLHQTVPGSAPGGGLVEVTVLRTQWVGANPSPQLVGLGPLPGVSNYFVGSDPSQWHTDVPNFGGVAYQNLYPGIDLRYYGNAQGQLEYDLVVQPGADPKAIRLQVQGAQGMSTDGQGDLILHTAQGDVIEQAPKLYQLRGDITQPVTGQFLPEADGTVGFTVGPYDPTAPLVIDPSLSLSVAKIIDANPASPDQLL
jgi:hypothetical protein